MKEDGRAEWVTYKRREKIMAEPRELEMIFMHRRLVIAEIESLPLRWLPPEGVDIVNVPVSIKLGPRVRGLYDHDRD